MKKILNSPGRREFIKASAAIAVANIMPVRTSKAGLFKNQDIRVWSCGGLAEAFMQANRCYREMTGIKIGYTGAFAAALGHSLLKGDSTDVFAGRVLKLAKKLRAKGKMLYFRPLCFTEYVIVTPLGNPAGIKEIADLARPGIKVVLAPDASPPGGKATLALLKRAGIQKKALENAVVRGSCVQRIMKYVIHGKGDAAIVERRITRIPRFVGKVESISIPDQYQPPPPLTFTIGVMRTARDKELAGEYVEFITSERGQSFFQKQGFIPAISERGRTLVERFGVKDV